MEKALHIVETPQNNTVKYSEVFIKGDLSRLSNEERLEYYMTVCATIGLNPTTQPLQYLELGDGKGGKKTVLYARKDCTDQLRDLKNVSISLQPPQYSDGLCIVTAIAQLPSGRQDSDVGIVNVGGLKGDFLANAVMKAVTKSKRRVTLSICGLGMLDETEIETIPDARPVEMNMETGAITIQEEECQEEQQIQQQAQKTVAELFAEKAASFGFTRTKKDELRHLAKVLLVREPTKKDDYRACLDFSNDDWRKSCRQAEQDIADVSPPQPEPAPLVDVAPVDHTKEAMAK